MRTFNKETTSESYTGNISITDRVDSGYDIKINRETIFVEDLENITEIANPYWLNGVMDHMDSEEFEIIPAPVVNNVVRPEFAIWGLAEKTKKMPAYTVPSGLDFNKDLKSELHADVVYTSYGAPLQKTYYANYDGVTYSDPIIHEDFIDKRDEAGIIEYRDQVICWYYTDGTHQEHDSPDIKRLRHYYNPEQAIKEAKDRRQSILYTLQKNIMGLMIATEVAIPTPTMTMQEVVQEGHKFLDTYSDETMRWVNAESDSLGEVALTADGVLFPWLDNPIDENGTLIRHVIALTLDATI